MSCQLESERDRLYATFEETVLAVHARSNAKNVVLEKMLDEYRDVFEVKKQQFTSVLRASNLDPVVLQVSTRQRVHGVCDDSVLRIWSTHALPCIFMHVSLSLSLSVSLFVCLY